MRVLLGGLVLAFCGTLAANDKKDEKIDATKLVGKWQPKEKKEAVIEYTKDGKMLLTVTGEKEFKAEGTYTVDGSKVSVTLKLGDKEQKSVRTVTKLTDADLVTVDDTGMERAFVRLKDKK